MNATSTTKRTRAPLAVALALAIACGLALSAPPGAHADDGAQGRLSSTQLAAQAKAKATTAKNTKYVKVKVLSKIGYERDGTLKTSERFKYRNDGLLKKHYFSRDVIHNHCTETFNYDSRKLLKRWTLSDNGSPAATHVYKRDAKGRVTEATHVLKNKGLVGYNVSYSIVKKIHSTYRYKGMRPVSETRTQWYERDNTRASVTTHKIYRAAKKLGGYEVAQIRGNSRKAEATYFIWKNGSIGGIAAKKWDTPYGDLNFKWYKYNYKLTLTKDGLPDTITTCDRQGNVIRIRTKYYYKTIKVPAQLAKRVRNQRYELLQDMYGLKLEFGIGDNFNWKNSALFQWESPLFSRDHWNDSIKSFGPAASMKGSTWKDTAPAW